MDYLILESDLLILLQAFDSLKLCRVLRNESTALDDVRDIGQVVLYSELLNIAKELVTRDVSKRILDPGYMLVDCPEIGIHPTYLALRFTLRSTCSRGYPFSSEEESMRMGSIFSDMVGDLVLVQLGCV